ncbi:hypothetical protein QWA68_007078 [Fusarium oxysporum]|nr:hypothetical protein QWA68_007078 [Fusarium oxysporum]
MATFPVITVCTVGQLGFWKSSVEEIKETYPLIRANVPRRSPTYLPPPLPVKEKMDEIYRFQWAVDECIVFLREHTTNGEELMVLRVIEWLAAAQRNDTGRIQRAIWTIDPDRFRREMREGYAHGGSVQAIQSPDGGSNAGGDAGGNVGGN